MKKPLMGYRIAQRSVFNKQKKPDLPIKLKIRLRKFQSVSIIVSVCSDEVTDIRTVLSGSYIPMVKNALFIGLASLALKI